MTYALICNDPYCYNVEKYTYIIFEFRFIQKRTSISFVLILNFFFYVCGTERVVIFFFFFCILEIDKSHGVLHKANMG